MAARPPIIVGDFALDELVGQGGMAQVWHARHRTLGRPAAVKIMRSVLTDDAAFVEGFHREVRAVAGLDHPGVVGVFDTGTVDAMASDASGGALSVGSPWLAMEYAGGGDLTRWALPVSWGILHGLLLEMLDALAHAHARGVIHRDLKPANILVRDDAAERRLMLTDFGIAHVVEPRLDSDAVGATSSGTPHYMAPEQIRGHWRDYGPWTDLYALGCLAYELACGRPPFDGKSAVAIAMKQVSAAVPHLGETRGTPPGFETWVRRLLAKRPEDRFETAADAAWHLARLPAPHSVASIRPTAMGIGLDTLPRLTMPSTVVGTLAVLVDTALLDAVAPRTSNPPGGSIDRQPTSEADHAVPPMPSNWRLPDGAGTGHRALGTGLFAVRETPFVGRHAERDRLWQSLLKVRQSGRVQMVLIEGAGGSGKTRLAEWLARRAEEVGAAIAVRVDYGPVPSPLDGILAAMRSWFRGDELARPALRKRIHERLRRMLPFLAADDLTDAADGLAALLDPDPEGEGTPKSPVEQRAEASFWLRHGTDRRPLVLRIDDAHFNLEGMALAEHLLSDGPQAPILIVATIQPGRMPVGSSRAEMRARLALRDDVDIISLGPLPPDDHTRFIRALLELAPGPLAAVRAATEGDTWYATQLVASWIEDGALAPAPEGYDAVATLDVPDEPGALVRRRLDRFAAAFADPSRVHTALWAAAALGHTVDRGEWRRLCAVRGARPPSGLVTALADRGWARFVPGGWAFTHDAWRDGLIAGARSKGVWTALNAACARVLRAASESAVGWRRIARHHAEAGAWGPAMQAALKAARMALAVSDYRRTIELTERAEHAADRTHRTSDDPLRGEAQIIAAEALRYLGRTDEARARLDALIDHPVAGIQAHRRRLLAGLAHFAGKRREAEALYRDAAARFVADGDVLGEIRSLHGLAWVQITHGEYAVAQETFAGAAELARTHGFESDEAWCLHGLASSIIFRGGQTALEPAERALAMFIRLGVRGGEAAARMFVADALGLAGRFDEARAPYLEAISLWDTLGSNFVGVGLTGLGLMLLDAGENEEARDAFDRAAQTDGGIPRQFALLHAVGAGLAAMRDGDPAPWIESMRHVQVRGVVAPRLRQNLVELACALEPIDRASAITTWHWAASAWAPIDARVAREATQRSNALRAREVT